MAAFVNPACRRLTASSFQQAPLAPRSRPDGVFGQAIVSALPIMPKVPPDRVIAGPTGGRPGSGGR